MKAHYFLNPQVYYFLVPHFACERKELWDKGFLYSVERLHCSCFPFDNHRRLSDIANRPNAFRGWLVFFFSSRKKKHQHVFMYFTNLSY